MNQTARDFRTRAARVGPAARAQVADRALRAIERLRKQFQHKIDDQPRRDAKRHWWLGESHLLGLERQLRLAADGARAGLDEAVQAFTPEAAAVYEAAEVKPR